MVLAAATAPAHAAGAPAGRGMWIWYMDRSLGGNVDAIAAQARAQGIDHVEVKAADGTRRWSQFSPRLVARFHAAGLRVCAWQYVYGTDPVGEANVGIAAVRDGADCLIIDAEVEYDGRYAAAQTYLHTLRAAIGAHYPLALASFPYVDYHPAFPYSVFLGPGGAQFNMPQMYWHDIGVDPARVFHHTYSFNRIYGRSIIPLGQSDGTVTAAGVQRFRSLAVSYRAPGISWWDFAWTSANFLWPAIGAPVLTAPTRASLTYPVLAHGAKGDHVVLLQEHLSGVDGAGQRVTGIFGDQTLHNVRAFQRSRRLAVTGTVDVATWRALLRVRRVNIAWGSSATSASTGAHAPLAPESATLPDRRLEIPVLGSEHTPAAGRVDPG